MEARRSGVIQGMFAGPWAAPRPGPLAAERGNLQPGARAWLVPPSMAARDLNPGGHSLPGPLRREMESLFKAGFSDVRIREGAGASAFGARALTSGSSILFAPGQFAPGSGEGRRLLGHELSHVIQQRSGRAINPFGRGLALLRDGAMEAEASRMGAWAASGRSAGPDDGPFGDRIDRARGRMFEDEARRRPPEGPGQAGPRARQLPAVVYHGTGAVLDRYPSGSGNWFSWDLDAAKGYSRSIPGGSLIYRYGVVNRSDRNLLLLRHQGEFSRTLDRLVVEQGKGDVDGWIELGPGASLMLANPVAYLEFDAVMGLVGGPEGGPPSWTGWRPSVDQIEAEAGAWCRFPRGRRGPGSRGAHDRLLAQEIARRLALPRAGRRQSVDGEPSSGRLSSPWGSRP